MQADFTRPSDHAIQPSDEDLTKFYGTLGRISKNLTKANWAYLCKHPEIRAIIRVIVIETIKQEPTDIYAFAAYLFDCSHNTELITMINKELERVNEQLKASAWRPGDGEDVFTESTDSSTKKNECSQGLIINDDNDDCPSMHPADLCNDNFKPRC